MRRRGPWTRVTITLLMTTAFAVAQDQPQQPVAADPVQPPATAAPASPRADAAPETSPPAMNGGQTTNEDGWPLTLANPFSRLLPRPAKLAKGDLVLLTLYGMNGPGVPTPFYLHVDVNGAMSVPLVGMIDVDGLTTDRAATKVSKALADASLVRDGIVTIGLVMTAAESGLSPGVIRQGDALMVTVFDLVGNGRRLVSMAMVGDDGQIELPLGGPVKLEGLTEGQADSAVQARLADKRVLPRATVSVLRLPPAIEATK